MRQISNRVSRQADSAVSEGPLQIQAGAFVNQGKATIANAYLLGRICADRKNGNVDNEQCEE